MASRICFGSKVWDRRVVLGNLTKAEPSITRRFEDYELRLPDVASFFNLLVRCSSKLTILGTSPNTEYEYRVRRERL
jgi:hypothetical protein